MTRCAKLVAGIAVGAAVCTIGCGRDAEPPAAPPSTPAVTGSLSPEAAATVQAMRAIGEAIEERYRAEGGAYGFASDIEGLAAGLEPEFVDPCPRTDGWGNPFVVDAGDGWMELRSLGADGRRDTTPAAGATDDPNADIVWGEGFMQWPSGMTP